MRLCLYACVLGAEQLRDEDGAPSEIENRIDETEGQTHSLSAIIAEPQP